MKKAIPLEIFDKDGNMVKIETRDEEGQHILDIVWDENDEQTPENRAEFRKWAYGFLEKNKGYKVVK
jgi:hypothetical protein